MSTRGVTASGSFVNYYVFSDGCGAWASVAPQCSSRVHVMKELPLVASLLQILRNGRILLLETAPRQHPENETIPILERIRR